MELVQPGKRQIRLGRPPAVSPVDGAVEKAWREMTLSKDH